MAATPSTATSSTVTLCSVDDCAERVSSRGFCRRHYRLFMRNGVPEHVRNWNPGAPCAVDDCDQPRLARGLCQRHYWRLMRTGSTELQRGRVCRRCGGTGPFIPWAPGRPATACVACRRRQSRESGLRKRQQLRADVLAAYGGVCACCGEREQAFLAIDHIDGGGTQHRQTPEVSRVGFYRWLKREDYPEGFQVLCHNCNFAKSRGGCPHRTSAGAASPSQPRYGAPVEDLGRVKSQAESSAPPPRSSVETDAERTDPEGAETMTVVPHIIVTTTTDTAIVTGAAGAQLCGGGVRRRAEGHTLRGARRRAVARRPPDARGFAQDHHQRLKQERSLQESRKIAGGSSKNASHRERARSREVRARTLPPGNAQDHVPVRARTPAPSRARQRSPSMSRQRWRQRTPASINGDPGAWKTIFGSTWPNPLIASVGANLMSVADRGVPFVPIETSTDFLSLLNALDNTPEVREQLLGTPVETLVVDCFDHFQQVMAAERKRDQRKDVLSASDWGWLGDEMRAILRRLRTLPLHVLVLGHLKLVEDSDTGSFVVMPSYAGQLSADIAGFVDLALAFRSATTSEQDGDGNATRVVHRYAQTYSDARYPWEYTRTAGEERTPVLALTRPEGGHPCADLRGSILR